jgi:signal transduction histidine kinase
MWQSEPLEVRPDDLITFARRSFQLSPFQHPNSSIPTRELLASAVMNLLQNAFKNTPSGGHVVLRARAQQRQLLLEIEDECGGIPQSRGDLFQVFGDRRGSDRSGVGLGLSTFTAAPVFR